MFSSLKSVVKISICLAISKKSDLKLHVPMAIKTAIIGMIIFFFLGTA